MKLIGDVPADRQTTPRVDQVDQAVRLVDVRQHSLPWDPRRSVRADIGGEGTGGKGWELAPTVMRL
jgi:hypothetical protein